MNGDRLGTGGAVPAGTDLNSLPPHLKPGAGSKPTSPSSGPGTPSSGKSTVSPPNAHYVTTIPSSSQPGSASLHARLSPRLATPKPASPLVNTTGTPAGNGTHTRKHSPPNLVIRQTRSPDGATCEIVRPSSPHETVSKVNVANKRKRRGAVQDEAPTKPAKCPLLSDTNSGRSHVQENNGKDATYKKVVNGAVAGKLYSKSGNAESKTTSQLSSGTSLGTRQVSPVGHAVPVTCVQSIHPNIHPETPKPGLNDRRNASFSIDVDALARLNQTPSVSSDRSDNMLDRTPTSVMRTPKVKTTAELIQDLHSKAGMRLSGSKTVTKIAMNQIERESDHIDSIVPAGAKPRFRRKPGTAVAPPPSTSKSLIKTKTEMVEKFLQSSVSNEPESPPPDNSTHGLIDLIEQDNNRVASLAGISVELPLEEDSRSSFISVPSQPCDVDPWSLLPPLDLDNVDLGDDSYELPEQLPPTEADVDRLLMEQWSGVNGQLDYQDCWQDWTQVLSVPSENSNLLHILPYVCLD